MFCGIYVITPMNIVRCTMYNMMYLKSAPLLGNPVFQSYCQAMVDIDQAHVTRMLGFKD